MIQKKLLDGSMSVFVLVWFGQLISTIGTAISGFALGVWVFETTGSSTQAALVLLSTTLPGILISPVAGALVDRWNRRTVMMLSDSIAGAFTLLLLVFIRVNSLAVWHIYIITAVNSVCNTFQIPAYSAATTLLVPKKQLGRANGMMQTAKSFESIIAPTLAGILMTKIPIHGILLIDFGTFLFAVFTLLFIHFPSAKTSETEINAYQSLFHQAKQGWQYLQERPGLLSLAMTFAAWNLPNALIIALFNPLVLSFGSSASLGFAISMGGIGSLVGSLVMSAWGGPKERVKGIVVGGLVYGFVFMLSGVYPSALLVAGANFVGMFTMPIVLGTSNVIWQTKTVPDMQGRVFSLKRMFGMATLPIGFLIAGPLADKVFEPLFVEGTFLASTIGQIIGVGKGRGIGFIYILSGLILMITVVGAYSYPPFRNLEEEIPDVIE